MIKYTVYKRFYLIKIKSLLANFSFATIIIMKKTLRQKLILLEKNNRLWRIHPFWIKLNKAINKTSQFLQIKQNTIRQKRFQKYKRDGASEHVHMKLDTPLFVHQLSRYLIDGPFMNQITIEDIQISYSLKYEHLEK